MQEYINRAKKIINPNAPLILSNNKFYYRNRIIDKATSLYAEDPKNLSTLYDWFRKDIITDQTRADHFGVQIGDSIGYIKSPKDKTFYNKLALVKKKIKKELASNL
jgi:hypothetical protein